MIDVWSLAINRMNFFLLVWNFFSKMGVIAAIAKSKVTALILA